MVNHGLENGKGKIMRGGKGGRQEAFTPHNVRRSAFGARRSVGKGFRIDLLLAFHGLLSRTGLIVAWSGVPG